MFDCTDSVAMPLASEQSCLLRSVTFGYSVATARLRFAIHRIHEEKQDGTHHERKYAIPERGIVFTSGRVHDTGDEGPDQTRSFVHDNVKGEHLGFLPNGDELREH